MEHYTAMRMNELWLHTMTWVNYTYIILRNKQNTYVYSHIFKLKKTKICLKGGIYSKDNQENDYKSQGGDYVLGQRYEGEQQMCVLGEPWEGAS